ncbi:hypothetical protein PENSPDRAFT_679728 [Peniophora sp. CONT]|nr:hypothetical protein PENSPDRAFT_679728 [Peniophora sp. CONT]
MSLLASALLYLAHLIYSISLAVWSVHGRWLNRTPLPLAARRSKIPKHLGVILVCGEDVAGKPAVQDAFVRSAERVAAWCRVAEIKHLTVYDRWGVLLNSSKEVKERVNAFEHGVKAERVQAAVVYPPTPPMTEDTASQYSEDASSRDALGVATISPELSLDGLHVKDGLRRRGLAHDHGASPTLLKVQLASLSAGRETMASVANSFLFAARHNVHSKPGSKRSHVSVEELQDILEGDGGLDAPDLMIVHHITCPTRQKPPLEMYGFPPWQTRLTEIYYDGSWPLHARLLRHISSALVRHSLLSEVEFRRALDLFSKAEFRVGK